MSTYATDTDLLHWEPAIFKEATIPSQTLLAGSGDLSGTTFTISAGSFVTAGVQPGHVVTIAGSINGSFPVVAVNSATSLTLSVLYDRLLPDDATVDARPIGMASNVPFTIKTCRPQIALVSEMLRQAIDVKNASAILNPQALRRPAALGTLQMLYAASAAVAIDEAELATRAQMYERLYRRAMRAAKIEIDLNGDGRTDLIRCPALPRLRRGA
jgi:hypothetical protein